MSSLMLVRLLARGALVSGIATTLAFHSELVWYLMGLTAVVCAIGFVTAMRGAYDALQQCRDFLESRREGQGVSPEDELPWWYP